MFDGLALKRFRTKLGYSMSKLAEMADCSVNDISRYENHGRIPRPGRLKKLAEALQIDVSELDKASDPLRQRIKLAVDELNEIQKAKVLIYILELLGRKDNG